MSPVLAQDTARPAPLQLDGIDAERLTGGRFVAAVRSITIVGAVLDHRAVTAGCLFACVRGERVDGHDFAAAAVAAGAAMVLAATALDLPVPVLVVPDVVRALQALAAEQRRRLSACRWIAVCGANGKTTSKELIAAACRGAQRRVHATSGNLNNHLGVPLTVLRTPADAHTAVIELGSNHPGEVAVLAAIVQPHVAVVTSIGPEHLEGFGDLAGVAREECSVFSSLPGDGTAVIGLHGVSAHGDPQAMVTIARQAAGARRLIVLDDAQRPTGVAGAVSCAGRVGELSVRIDTSAGSAEIPLAGAHNLANASLAWQAATAAGCDGAAALRGLSTAVPVAGRLVPRPLGDSLIIDDTYNANPASMIAGLEVLARCPGRRLAVLGAMGELGAAQHEGHAQVGAHARALNIPVIVMAGRGGLVDAHLPLAQAAGAPIAADHAAAIALVRAELARGPLTVLVKASRSQALEKVVEGLLVAGARPC